MYLLLELLFLMSEVLLLEELLESLKQMSYEILDRNNGKQIMLMI